MINYPEWTTQQLDQIVGPYVGPCGICGCDDARHRLADSLAGLYLAGDSVETIRQEFPSMTDLQLCALVSALGQEGFDERTHNLSMAGLAWLRNKGEHS